MKHPLLTFAGLLVATTAAQAQPAVVYDMGGKFDKSFNEAAYNGAERWKKETGKQYLEFEVTNEAQREQAVRRMAEKGASPIIAMSFSGQCIGSGCGCCQVTRRRFLAGCAACAAGAAGLAPSMLKGLST